MNRTHVLLVAPLVVLATVVACGRFLEAAGSGDGVDASADGSGANAEGGAEGGPTPPPWSAVLGCPLADCPDGIDTCKDENCNDDERDFSLTGTIDVDLDAGVCTLRSNGPSNTAFRIEPRPFPRTFAALSLKVLDLPSDRVFARLSIEGAPNAERFILRRTNGAFEMCEENANGTRCTSPLAVEPPQTFHLFGIVTSEDPPRATFGFGTTENACSGQRALDVTVPFPQGDIRGEIGCIGDGPACQLRFDDGLLLVKAE